MRTSGPLDIARATARESATGYGAPWQLLSRAICARPSIWVQHPFLGPLIQDSEIHADGTVSYGTIAHDRCADGFRSHGIGGGAGTTDSGPVWLRGLLPHGDLRGVTVSMTGATTQGIVAHQTCAR